MDKFKDIDNNTKDKYFKIRLTQQDKDKLHELAKNAGYKSTSKYVLECALNPVLYIENSKPFIDTNTHLSRIGTNINQIARRVHTREYVLEDDLKEIKALLLQQREYIKLLKNFQFYEKSNIEKIERFKTHGVYKD